MESTDNQEVTGTMVPEAAKQVSDTRDRWPWVEPFVKTDRMLSALKKGVKGRVNRYFAKLGLFTLEMACEDAGQSLRCNH